MLMYGPGGLPDEIFESRIVFIKKTRTPSSPLDYRPIAIGNSIRIFHWILSRRIEGSISNHPDQVSFKRVDGVGYNILKLHNILNESWKKYRELVVMVLDIKKAFDSVSQEVLHQIRLSRGFPMKLADYITSFSKATSMIVGNTPIKTAGRGVKQGDPLSPVLFNLALDTVLFHLEASPAGLRSSAGMN